MSIPQIMVLKLSNEIAIRDDLTFVKQSPADAEHPPPERHALGGEGEIC